MKMKKILNEWKKFVNENYIKLMQLDDYIDTFNIGDNTTAEDLTDYLKGRIEQRPDLKDTIFKHLKAAERYAELGKPEKAEIAAQVRKNLGSDDGEASSFDKRKQQIVKIHDGFVDFLEVEDIFPPGKIPKSVMDALMNVAMLAVDAMENDLDERCQKGYKTHPKRKTKKMYGKTYRNCVKAE